MCSDKMVKKIFVCSPLRGDVEENIKKARTYARYIALCENIPIVPHIYFTMFLDDSDKNERAIGIKMGIELMKICDEMWVFSLIISEGMKMEIDEWLEMGNSRENIKYVSEVDALGIIDTVSRIRVIENGKNTK